MFPAVLITPNWKQQIFIKRRMDEFWCIHIFEQYTATGKPPATFSNVDESTARMLSKSKPRLKGCVLCDSSYTRFSTPPSGPLSCLPVLKRENSLSSLLSWNCSFSHCPVLHTEVAEELGRAAAASSVVPYLPRLPLLPSKTRTLKKQGENKENIEGAQDATENSASSSAPGTTPWGGRGKLPCLKSHGAWSIYFHFPARLPQGKVWRASVSFTTLVRGSALPVLGVVMCPFTTRLCLPLHFLNSWFSDSCSPYGSGKNFFTESDRWSQIVL